MILYRRCPTEGTVHQERLYGPGPPVRSCRLVRPAPAQPDAYVRVDEGSLIQPAGFRRHRAAGTCSTGPWSSEEMDLFGISGVHIPDNNV